MSRQVSPSTDKVYGLQRVTRFWGVSRATVYRHRHLTQAVERKRPDSVTDDLGRKAKAAVWVRHPRHARQPVTSTRLRPT
jgi:hypothetical protein